MNERLDNEVKEWEAEATDRFKQDMILSMAKSIFIECAHIYKPNDREAFLEVVRQNAISAIHVAEVWHNVQQEYINGTLDVPDKA